MQTATIVKLINYLILLTSVVILCLSFSIFDFIVVNKMYYTVPDEHLLINTDLFYWFTGSASLCFMLSLATIFYEGAPISVQETALRFSCSVSMLHIVLLCCSCVLCAVCALFSANAGNDLHRYAFHATPRQFQMASHWYYVRLRSILVMFSIGSILSAAELCFLYLGIHCSYRSFAQLPQNKAQALSAQTNLFI